MVSPSKVQHQEQKQPSRENKPERRSHVRIQKGLKPLERQSFYLDIKNHATSAKLEARIRELGGAIELFLVRSVSIVVSDRVDKAGYANSEKRKWGCANVGSGGPPLPRSIDVPTPTPTPPTPFLSSECSLSNSAALRGQTAQRSKSRVDAMLERALTQPQQCSVDPLSNAQNWGIPIWAIDKLQAWLDKIYASLKDTDNLKHPKYGNQQNSGKDLKVRRLKGPYIKFESFHRSTRPVFLELPAWPTLNFYGAPGSCPFNVRRREKLDNKDIGKEVNENREGIESVKKPGEKEMTRRPRTTVARTRRAEQLVSGYCEICRTGYRDLSKHVQSDQHLNFVRNDDNFLSLDTLISAGANVEAFLKLNRTKDIEKDCGLFRNGDRDLHDMILPDDDRTNKSAKTLNSFGVEEIKMVQCNGARRNLNLKLNSHHNLRTRAKHESGHLLRSKGSPWHEVDKNEKFYDKLEGFTIKKRTKGTIWIEEDDPDEDYMQEHDLNEPKREDYKPKELAQDEKDDEIGRTKPDDTRTQDFGKTVILVNEQNGVSNPEYFVPSHDYPKFRDCEVKESNLSTKTGSAVDSVNINGISGNFCVQSCKLIKNETCEGYDPESRATLEGRRCAEECGEGRIDSEAKRCEEIVAFGVGGKSEQNAFKIPQSAERECREERTKWPGRSGGGRRGGRSLRGRHRLSVEERLIEDNRAYYKVEGPEKEKEKEKERKEATSSEKPVVVRFKRVRKSELSLLSDEAESFMFGEPKREDSSETSDGEQSSVLPRDTESEYNDSANSVVLSSPLNTSSPIKQEGNDEDSQDSLGLGRVRKRRRTQAEALIKDNTDYYKFETPGSRLRYQAPLTGVKEYADREGAEGTTEEERVTRAEELVEKVYPSKPSAEVEKMQFSFEAIPKSEPWYQTYQRQDEGAEFWHYFSECDARKPFLLPYEIDNFHETLGRCQSRGEIKGKKGRGRGLGSVGGRSPRKSPRCHASTLAIMSTIIRKKEQQQQQQQQSSTLYTIEECQSIRSQSSTPKPDQRYETKSDVDEELREMAKTIDEMLNAKGALELDDSLEPDDVLAELNHCDSNVPKGPPANLLELLDNCHEIGNCLENSSCASSECGETASESPLKRRKKRKNRTGWPGIKMRKKLHSSKPLLDCERESPLEKDEPRNEDGFGIKVPGLVSDRLTEEVAAATIVKLSCGNLREEQQQQQLNGAQKKEGVSSSLDGCSSSHSAGNPATNREKGTLETVGGSKLVASYEGGDSASLPDVRGETDRSFASKKEFGFGKELSPGEEVSENDPGNDENHENVFRKDVNAIPISEQRRFLGKTPIKKRSRENQSNEACEPGVELENHEILCRKDAESRIVPAKHQNPNGLSGKRSQKEHPETPGGELVRHNSVYRRNRVTARRRVYSRKRPRKNNMPSDSMYEDENCKKGSYSVLVHQ
ncbi:hypothetical protein KM043_001765 [Ampulex compressa]|nr:hypothetical protein KM043_001765 [Ampulex compressa]